MEVRIEDTGRPFARSLGIWKPSICTIEKWICIRSIVSMHPCSSPQDQDSFDGSDRGSKSTTERIAEGLLGLFIVIEQRE